MLHNRGCIGGYLTYLCAASSPTVVASDGGEGVSVSAPVTLWGQQNDPSGGFRSIPTYGWTDAFMFDT